MVLGTFVASALGVMVTNAYLEPTLDQEEPAEVFRVQVKELQPDDTKDSKGQGLEAPSMEEPEIVVSALSHNLPKTEPSIFKPKFKRFDPDR